jgi:phosphopantothenate-cysteine ligase
MDEGWLHRVLQGELHTSLFARHPLLIKNRSQLETDESLIIPKARAALERYGHQVVIGNDLHNRKYKVVFVSKLASRSNTPSAEHEYVESWLRIETPSSSRIGHTKEIEEDIIAELLQRHNAWINQSR